MKKEDIATLLIPTLTKYNSGHYSYDSKRHALEIIDRLVEIGMLPPKTMSRPEYHKSTGKQLQTIAKFEWDE